MAKTNGKSVKLHVWYLHSKLLQNFSFISRIPTWGVPSVLIESGPYVWVSDSVEEITL